MVRWQRLNANIVGTIIIVIFAVVGMGFSVRATIRQDRTLDELTTYSNCQADWNRFLVRALKVRGQATQSAQDELDLLIDTTATAKSREEVAAALQRYREARAKAKEINAKTPLPEAPSSTCERK